MYLYNAIVIRDRTNLEEICKEVLRRMLRHLLKSKERGIDRSVIPRFEFLIQIIPLKFKVMMGVKRFVENMEKGAEAEQQGTIRNKEKVGKKAKRCLWIINREVAPDITRRMLKSDTMMAGIKQGVVKCWDR